VVLRHNLVFGGGLKDDDDNGACHLVGNITGKDQSFVDPAKRDFHLQPGSPAIAAGIADLAPAHDADGHPRPKGKRPDLGAYAYR
jgi:hypothetical protein